MKPKEDTIAAIVTAPGESGVAIVRLSGPESRAIADQVVFCAGDPPSRRPTHTATHGYARNAHGAKLDEVLLVGMWAPRSYTGEDVIEIQGHGGRAAPRTILRRVLECGARMAEPGEFTRRAFLNGRIDLTQAEAVMDLVRSVSDRAASAAVEQLDGSLRNSIERVYEQLLAVQSGLEAALDFPEDELPELNIEKLNETLVQAGRRMEELLNTWNEGHLLREGTVVAIVGRPNSGKSTLLNALLGKDRAIVSEVAGTTRDTIEETLIIDGYPVRLIDTAGLREVHCTVESKGIERTRKTMAYADMILYLIDASAPLGKEDAENLAALDPARSLIVLNKKDLGVIVQTKDCKQITSVQVSAIKGVGINDLKSELQNRLTSAAPLEGGAVISERHRERLVKARDAVRASRDLLRSGDEENFVPAAEQIKCASEEIGSITGRIYSDELMDAIFSKFCIGK